jgi:HAD superfamily hydrolase (TIGR01549 family)
MQRLPLDSIEAVFLDAGNTVVGIDVGLIADELGLLGHAADVALLRRAEVAARPAVSELIAARRPGESRDTLGFWMRHMLNDALGLEGGEIAALVDQLLQRLGEPEKRLRLWSARLDDVPEALASLQRAEIPLVVVSNSDGSCERLLTSVGLRGFFRGVIDSQLVGVEKPDPRIFSHALEISRSDPARTLHVGDMHAADVVGARAAGIHPVLLDPYGDWGDVDCATATGVPEVAREILRQRSGS